jgi:peptidoglycan/LPS O-acetylase OafA/YrhL
MRGVAAAAIVVLHGRALFGWSPDAGVLAVDLFFVLSGFVIAHAYEERLKAGMTAIQFARIRIIRFWPLYLLGFIGGLAIEGTKVAIGYHTSIGAFEVGFAAITGLFFLPGWPDIRVTLFPLNPPSWSLFFELLVNIAFAAVHRYLTNRILMIACTVGAGGLILAAVTIGGTGGGFAWHDCWLGFARVGFSFPLGVLLYRTRPLQALHVSWLIPCAILAALLCASPGKYNALYNLFFVMVASPLLVACGASIQPPESMRRICNYLGVLSYAIYIIHDPLMQAGSFVARLRTH